MNLFFKTFAFFALRVILEAKVFCFDLLVKYNRCREDYRSEEKRLPAVALIGIFWKVKGQTHK